MAFGLRDDEAFVKSVAVDPAAMTAEFGVPLLPVEIAELRRRTSDARLTASIASDYGEGHPDTFAGTYIDPATGQVVALFTRDLAGHTERLRALLLPGSPISLRVSANTKVALEELHDRLLSGHEWAQAHGVHLGSMEVDIVRNIVSVLARTEDPKLLDEATMHFEAEGKIEYIWDEDWLAELPRGRLVGRIVDAASRPLALGDLEVQAIGDIGSYEPDGGVAYGTRPDGSFDLPRLAPMMWTVNILRPREDQPALVIGTARVLVVSGQTSRVEILVDP